jgi:hypothetical protein
MVRIHPWPPFFNNLGQPLPIEEWPKSGKRATRIASKLRKFIAKNQKKNLTPERNVATL